MPGITDPSEQYFKDGIWGYDSTVWRKLALLFGYSSRLAEAATTVSTGAADTFVDIPNPLASEIWIVQSASLRHDDPVNRSMEIQIRSPTVAVIAALGAGYAAWVPLVWNGAVPLAQNDMIRGHGVAIAIGQTLYLEIWGYKMGITM